MTAVTYQGVSTAGDSNGSGLTGLTRPTTTASDQFMVELYYESGVDPATGAVAFSNGTWTLESQQVQVGTTPDFHHVRYRSAYVAEGSTFNITWNATIGAVWRSATVSAYRAVDATTPEDVAATTAASVASSTSATAPGVTIVTGDAMAVYGEADYDGANVTPPTGFTERTDFANIETADRLYTTAGATGDITATVSGGGAFNTAGLFVFRPAVPGGVTAKSAPKFQRTRRVWTRSRVW